MSSRVFFLMWHATSKQMMDDVVVSKKKMIYVLHIYQISIGFVVARR